MHAPEEDEAIWAYGGLTPATFYLFPYYDLLKHIFSVDRMPKPIRESMSRYYLDWLQGIMYMAPSKVLLAKNTHAGGILLLLLLQLLFVSTFHSFDYTSSLINLMS